MLTGDIKCEMWWYYIFPHLQGRRISLFGRPVDFIVKFHEFSWKYHRIFPLTFTVRYHKIGNFHNWTFSACHTAIWELKISEALLAATPTNMRVNVRFETKLVFRFETKKHGELSWKSGCQTFNMRLSWKLVNFMKASPIFGTKRWAGGKKSHTPISIVSKVSEGKTKIKFHSNICENSQNSHVKAKFHLQMKLKKFMIHSLFFTICKKFCNKRRMFSRHSKDKTKRMKFHHKKMDEFHEISSPMKFP